MLAQSSDIYDFVTELLDATQGAAEPQAIFTELLGYVKILCEDYNLNWEDVLKAGIEFSDAVVDREVEQILKNQMKGAAN